MELILERGTILYSEEDHELISKYNWGIDSTRGYVVTHFNYVCIRMHRLIMQAPDNIPVDHINGNKLDNRRENLRLSNSVENGQNKSKRANTTSKFLGVSYLKEEQTFRARITIDGKAVLIGTYVDEIDAAIARDLAIVHELPDSAYKLNFPEDLDIYKITPYTIKRKVIPKPSTELTIKSGYDDTDNPDVVRLLLENKPDIVILINREDYERIKYYTYHVNSQGYVGTNNVACGHHLLHRYVLNVTDSKVPVDHINGDKLNNTRENLRISNSTLNSQNKRKVIRENTTSKYLGVSYRADKRRWKTTINVNKKRIHIGYSRTEIAAALKRDLYIIEHLPDSHYPMNYRILNAEYLANNAV